MDFYSLTRHISIWASLWLTAHWEITLGSIAIVLICWLVICMGLILWCTKCMGDIRLCWPIRYSILTTSLTKRLFCTILWEGLLEQCLLWLRIILVPWCIIGWTQWRIRFLILLGSIILSRLLKRVLSILISWKIKWSKFSIRLKWIKNCLMKFLLCRRKKPNCRNLFWKRAFNRNLRVVIKKSQKLVFKLKLKKKRKLLKIKMLRKMKKKLKKKLSKKMRKKMRKLNRNWKINQKSRMKL